MPAPRKYDIDPEWDATLRADPCAYCGAPTRDLDHVLAVTRGGEDADTNLVGTCGPCNKAKQNDSLLIFLWKQSAPDPAVRSPYVGVHWRKDIKRWSAYVDLVRRRSLGTYDSPEAALGAVKRWWRDNPNAITPRAARTKQKHDALRVLWKQGLSQREIAERLDEPQPTIASRIHRMRQKDGLQRRGRGAPGRSRPPRAGIPVPGRGYRYSPHSIKPWLVQVQSLGEKLTERFATEDEARAAVAAFRETHLRTQRTKT